MYLRYTKRYAGEISIDEPIGTDTEGNNITLSDVLSSGDEVLDLVSTRIEVERLSGILDTALDERERLVICMRYGLCGYPAQTQNKVAQRLGISRSYVSGRGYCKQTHTNERD